MEDQREKLELGQLHSGEKGNVDKKGKPSRLILWAAGCFAAIGIGAFFFYFGFYRVAPAFDSVIYELGDTVSRDVSDYLLGMEWSVRLSELDISRVDTNRIGTYQAVVRHGRDEFLYEIIIEDTVPPVIIGKRATVYLAMGREYPPEKLIESVTDRDPQIMLCFLKGEADSALVCYEAPGCYDCVIIAEDSSGNRASVTVPVIVDSAPEISGVQDIYLALGSQVDYLEQVTAWDERDGDLTDRITVDDTGVILSQEGTYRLDYQVEDELGIDCVYYADITVVSPEELQQMIGRRQISRCSDRIIGAVNLYDSGVSDHDNIQETLEYVRPALVQLYYNTGRGYSAGSGYIMEITEDTIYICSARHVVEAHNVWDVYFYDGTRVRGVSLGCSDEFDVGVVTVPADLLPKKLMEQLMTVHIDEEYWSGLNDKRIDVGLERVDRAGGILRVSTGTLLKVKQYFMWSDQKEHTEVTLKLEHGDSGSAIFDGYGNLIGMAYAYSTSPRRYWCVPLDGIIECYEEITGRDIYVY